MHVLGLHRGSGYNIPEGPNKGEGAPTRIGRYEITSKNDLKQSFDGGASLPLERWVCEFSPSFTSDSLSNSGREASLLTVLKRGVVVVSSSSAAARRGGGGGGANEGRAKTTAATTATKEALVTSETTLSPGQTAVVHPGDVLYFQGCPRDLVGLRVLPGPAEKDAQELDRREREERKKKRKHAEEATAAAAAAVGAKEEAAEAKRERARGVLLRTPEPFHRWHLSFFNTRFSSQLEQWCRDEGATVTRLLLFDCEKGSTCEDAYLSLFPAPPLQETYGDGNGNGDLLSVAQRGEAAEAERVAAEVRAQGAPFFAEAQRRLRDAGLPPPPSRCPGSSSSAAGRVSAVVIGGGIKTTTTPPPQKSSSSCSSSPPASASALSPALSSPAAAEGDDENAEVCEIKVMRLAGLWPPPLWWWWEKEKEKKNPSSASTSTFSSTTSAAAALLPRSDFPVLLIPRTFVAGCLALPAEGSAARRRIEASRLPLVCAEFAAVAAAREARYLERLLVFVKGLLPACDVNVAKARAALAGTTSSSTSGLRERAKSKLEGEQNARDYARRKLVLIKRAAGSARRLRDEMEAWRDAERGGGAEMGTPAAARRSRKARVSPPPPLMPPLPPPPSVPAPPPPQQQQQQQQQQQLPPPAAPAPPPPQQQQQQQQQQQLPPPAAPAPTLSPPSSCPSLLPCGPLPPPEARTGGASGRPWGLGGVWLEPFSPPAASASCERILSNYRRPRARTIMAAAAAGGGGGGSGSAGKKAAAAATARTAASDDDDDGGGGDGDGFSDFDDEEEGPKTQPSSSSHRPCFHVACSARPYCLLPPLEEAQKNYALGAAGASSTPQARAAAHFKGLVIGRLISAVKACPFPLRTREDVFSRFDSLYRTSKGLGDRSFDKLWEVVSGQGGEDGDLRRNALLRREPGHEAIRELTRIPGVGLAKARHLFHDHGCSSARDLMTLLTPAQQLQLLSKQQRLGARHLEDFEQPVPRSEVAVVERGFRVAVAKVWGLALPAGASEQSLLLLPPAASSFAFSPSFLEVPGGRDGERAFVEAVGSYRRGNRATAGDIDILLSPPPPPPPVKSSGALFEGATQPSFSQEEQARSLRRSSSKKGTATATATEAATEATFSSSSSNKEQLIADLSLILAELQRLGFEIEEGSSSSSAAAVKGSAKGAATTAAAAASDDNGDDGDDDSGGEIAHASFSGAIRCPASLLEAAGCLPSSSPPRFRRLDVKLYPRRALPAALCYFSSGMTFSRCLRQWSRADSAAARAALLPLAQKAAQREFACSGRGPATTGEDPLQADSFHLSDKGLEVTRRGELGSKTRVSPYVSGKRNSTRTRNPHAFFAPSVFVPLECETDLFEALGLDYVPPHMRDLDEVATAVAGR